METQVYELGFVFVCSGKEAENKIWFLDSQPTVREGQGKLNEILSQ